MDNREKLRRALALYLVTDRHWLGGRTLEEVTEQAIRGGAGMVQLREKSLPDPEFLARANAMRALTRRLGVPLLINDNIEIALQCGADGIHIGQSDGSVMAARARLGAKKILGVSANTAEQALAAQEQGADYIGAGAVFPTGSKADANVIGLAELQKICAAVKIPVVAIGGITRENLPQLGGTGICGIAVISAILAQPDIQKAAAELFGQVQKNLAENSCAGVKILP